MQALEFRQAEAAAAIQPRAGWIAQVDANGVVRVDYPGNPFGPLDARSVVDLPRTAMVDGERTEVLLCFEAGDPQRPVILGILRVARVTEPAPEALSGDRLSFTAGQEMTFRCGEGSITLTADGRIVIKGTRLLSRASETNRIRGASVAIN
jgi:hypothetical protein